MLQFHMIQKSPNIPNNLHCLSIYLNCFESKVVQMLEESFNDCKAEKQKNAPGIGVTLYATNRH